ncbi:DEAD/DEAH box helicase [Paraherbaspirillum soli]|uniref:DEAD/DEAH box helicase n=1 Tax=Paraherbaspirillum soli TaxID=631222 RepID=A0ABW0M946_9BURK
MGGATVSVGRFRPRLTLQTLTRGDGLLGMKPSGPFGPRGGSVTVVQIAWTYSGGDGLRWETPAPTALLNRRPASSQFVEDAHGQRVLLRDLGAEADALDLVWDLGLHPIPAGSLQWRANSAAQAHPLHDQKHLWTLAQEDFFGDFWAEQLPALQAQGWAVVVRPGFAHESVPVEAWHLIVSPETGEVLGKEVAATMRGRAPAVTALGQPAGEGSWLLSLGIEIDGELLDLVPLLANLLQRDARWLDAARLAQIDDLSLVLLRAPGGKRIEAMAAPLKAIVGHMLELLTDPRRKDGPLRLSPWDAYRLDAMRQSLLDSQHQRAGPHGAWQLQGDAGLRALAHRLQDSGGPPAVAAPAGLGVSLRPYQLHGVAWLQYLRQHHLAGILADDMGLGKTAQALAHLLIEQQSGRLDRPALVVLPTSLVFNWQAEAQRMAPGLRVLTLQGPDRSRHFGRMAEHDVVLTTYPLLWRDRSALEAQPFHLLILDEAQTVKNAASRCANAVRRIQARHRLCITGTPLENNLGELWTQFDFLMPGFLGDAGSFMRLWRKPIEVGGETLRAQLLAQRVRPFILRRRKDQVATELPPRVEVVKRVQLQGRQRDLYESVRVAADEQVRGVLQRKGFAGAQITILDALLKLRQVCCDPYLLKGAQLQHAPSHTMERAKLELLRDMLPALVAEGRRILVFSQFTEMLSMIEAELSSLQLPWLALTGQTPPAQRGPVVAQFQGKSVPILLISLKAGGVGLNLTAADTVIHMDPWWNPAVQEQATARAHRIGQEQTVFVYQLVVEGSIEERMLELQARKAALAEGVLGSDAALAPKFNAEDLQALLAPLQQASAMHQAT